MSLKLKCTQITSIFAYSLHVAFMFHLTGIGFPLKHVGSIYIVMFDTELLCMTLCICVCFRAEIEVVQSDVSELETRLDKVRYVHLTPTHTLHIILSHCSTFRHSNTHTHSQYCWTHTPHVRRQWSERWAAVVEVLFTWQRAGSSCRCCFPIVLSYKRENYRLFCFDYDNLYSLLCVWAHTRYTFRSVHLIRDHTPRFCSLMILSKLKSNHHVTPKQNKSNKYMS